MSNCVKALPWPHRTKPLRGRGQQQPRPPGCIRHTPPPSFVNKVLLARKHLIPVASWLLCRQGHYFILLPAAVVILLLLHGRWCLLIKGGLSEGRTWVPVSALGGCETLGKLLGSLRLRSVYV